MNVLLDTHIVLWWLDDDPKLPERYREIIGDEETACSVSAATIWEISIKKALGKLELPNEYGAILRDQGFLELDILWRHCRALEDLPMIHRDPFDRLLIAQAVVEGFSLLCVDENMRKYDVEIL